jgi:MFS family permease
MDAFHVGIILIIFSIAFILVQLAAGGLSDRIGRLYPAAIALIVLIVALTAIPFADSLISLELLWLSMVQATAFYSPLYQRSSPTPYLL